MKESTMNILVVGCGVGGMMTALELNRRKVGSVRIVEKSPDVIARGDAFTILPAALSTLRHYPQMHKEFEKDVGFDGVQSLYKHTGASCGDRDAGRINGPNEAEWNYPRSVHSAKDVRVPWLASRWRFVKMLLAEVERQGIDIEWGVSIENYGEDSGRNIAWAETRDSRRLEADLVIAADGVGTKSHLAVTGRKVPATSSGYAVFRAAVPIEIVVAPEIVRKNLGWKIGDRPEFRIYLGQDMHMNVILTNDVFIPVLTHKDTGDADEAWHSTVPTSKVVEVAEKLEGWDPALLAMLKAIPDNTVVDWKLMWRDPQPKWASDGGRIIQVGDSAHSFLPTSGNGASQALEDAISLAACLALAGRDGVTQATKVHNLLRFERVSTLQKMGFVTRQSFHHLFNPDGSVSEEKAKSFDTLVRFGKWVWGHDPGTYAEEKYFVALQHLEKGTPFENTNLPPGFKYEPWTVAEEMEKEQRGIFSNLRKQGDWSV